MSAIIVRPARSSDIDVIAGIYNHYILETVVTFEEELVSPMTMRQRMTDVRSEKLPWLVAEQGDNVLGYAYASKWHARSAYRFAVESTVYLDRQHLQHGTGTQLYTALLKELQTLRYRTAIGVIALPNEASVKLHEKLDFKKVGHFTEVGFKLNQWVDVGYWQKNL